MAASLAELVQHLFLEHRLGLRRVTLEVVPGVGAPDVRMAIEPALRVLLAQLDQPPDERLVEEQEAQELPPRA
jgi:hypothetical protein